MKILNRWLPLCAFLLLSPWCVEARPAVGTPAPLRLCISDLPYPPFTYPDRDGLAQVWIRAAAQAQGRQVEFIARPWRRCLAESAKGHYAGVIGAAASAENRQMLNFPERDGRADTRLSFGETRMLVYRPLGSQASWDGRGFDGLAGPVLINAGISTLKSALQSLGVPCSDVAHSPQSVARMLLRGRGNIAVDHELRVHELLTQEEFRGRFEVLPQPFAVAPVYLAVAPSYYGEHRDEVRALWGALAALSRQHDSKP